jgi:CBS domain-containing protein
MNTNKLVSEVMTSNVMTADRRDSLRHVNSLMKEKHIRHLPVVDNGKLVGIVSNTDIMRLSFGDLYEGETGADEAMFDMLTLDQVMVHRPVSVRHDEFVEDVALKLASAEYHAFPVIDGDKVVGIITTTDVIKYLLTRGE